jgi:hypothetical protein
MIGPRYEHIPTEWALVGRLIHGERDQRIVDQMRNPISTDLHPHDIGNSWVESTMEMRLSHFIDSTHQGGHTHRGLFGNGKL